MKEVKVMMKMVVKVVQFQGTPPNDGKFTVEFSLMNNEDLWTLYVTPFRDTEEEAEKDFDEFVAKHAVKEVQGD